MKKLLLMAPLGTVLGLSVACTTVGPQGAAESGLGAAYRESTLANLNPAPSLLAPKDYTKSIAAPTMDAAYSTSQADYHFTMGETLSFEGQSARAVEEFKTTLVYDPNSVHVRLRLAAEYVRLGMITEAVEQGEAAVKMAPANIEAHMLLGGLYSGLKMFEPARGEFGKVLDIRPAHPEASVYIGALLAEQKKYDESVHYFEELAKNPEFKDHEKAYFYIGRVKTEQGKDHFAEAEKAFTKALSTKADYPEAANALAQLYHLENKDKAMETLLKSYQEKFGPEHEMARQLAHYYLEKEDFTPALAQLEIVDSFERDNLNIKIQIALILIEQKKYEQAAVRLEDVLQNAPESDKVRYYLGAVYEEIHRPELALQHYLKIPAGSTYFAESVVHSAYIMKTSSNMDGALVTMEKSIKAQDDLPQLYAFYATLLDEVKAFKKAEQMLQIAVAKFPANTQLRFFLGTIEDRLGNTPQTIAQMNKVLEIDQDHVQALNYLAYTYAELGRNLEDAAKLAGHALELQPNDGFILDTIGWIHFKKGETEEAIKFLEAAHKMKADEAIIAEHLGDAYLRHQMWQKAQKMYQRAAQFEQDVNHNGKLREKIANVKSQSQNLSRVPASESK